MTARQRILELTQLGNSVMWTTQCEWSLSRVSGVGHTKNDATDCSVTAMPTSIDSAAGQ